MRTPTYTITTGLTPLSVHFVYENLSGSGIDLSGYTANFQIKTSSNKLLLDITNDKLFVGYDDRSGFSFAADTPGLENGQIKLNSDKNGNSGLTGGVYVSISSNALEKVKKGKNTYSLKVIDANNNTTELLTGVLDRRLVAKARESNQRIKLGQNFIDNLKSVPSRTRSDSDNPVNNDVTFRFASDVSNSNINLTICDYPIPNPSRTKYISPTGSDSTGNGTKAYPYKTVKKAVNSFPNANNEECYIVFLEGIYSLNTLGAGNHAWTRSSGGTTSLMTTIGLNDTNNNIRKVTLMSEKPLKAVLLGSVIPTFVGSTGASSDIRIFSTDGPTFNQSGTIRKYNNGKNATEMTVFNGPTGFNSINFSETPYPVMLHGGITQDREKWESQVSRWTGYTSGTFGITYEAISVSAGVTSYYVSGSDIWNVVSALGAGFSWADTAIALHGGNNNVHISTVLDVNHSTQKIKTTSTPPSAFNSNSYGTDAFAFLGNPGFTMNHLSYAYQNNKLYYRGITYNTIRTNAISVGILTNNCTELTVCGFELGEFDNCIGNVSTGSTTNSNRKSLTVKYCLIRNTVSGSGINFGNHFNNKIFGNFLANTYYRPISGGSPSPAVISSGGGVGPIIMYPNEPYYPGYEATEISYNTCYNWKTYSGIYMQDGRNVLISNNTLYNLGSQHGNGIALYSGAGGISYYAGCRDVIMRKNFVYTPNNISLAINDKNINTTPWLIENNVFIGGIQYRDPFNLNGLIFKNNFGGIGHYNIYPKTDAWWFMYKNIYRYNAFGVDPVFDLELFPGGTTFNVGITGYLNREQTFGLTYMPQGFSGERTALMNLNAGTSAAAKQKYNIHSWIQSDAGQTLPNMWTNLFFQRMDYDRYVEYNGQPLAQQPVIFPYNQTKTLKFSELIVAASDATTRRTLQVNAVRDYYGNDFRLKPGITGATLGIGVNWSGPTANITNISTWWLFGLTLCSSVPVIENDFSSAISPDNVDNFYIPPPGSTEDTVTDPEDETDYGHDYRRNNNQNTASLVELTYKDYISNATIIGITAGYTAV